MIRKLRIGETAASNILSQGPSFLCAENRLGDYLCCGEAAMHRALEGRKDPENMALPAEPQAYGDSLLLIKF